MAQTLFAPAPTAFSPSIPSSPDPTPLRLLAFSVAEAALQSDPNSPSLALQSAMDGDWVGPWSQTKAASASTRPRVPVLRQGRLWDVVERAKERKDRGLGECRIYQSIERSLIPASPTSFNEPLPSSPPVSPASYNFVLPPRSPLAASIAVKHSKPRPDLGPRPFPLYTRSAEPSPTNSTFSGLDQTVPPPEFVPRFDKRGSPCAPSQQLREQAASPVRPTSRHTARLPSLKQIQAKMGQSSGSHRRSGSAGSIPLPARPKQTQRTGSDDSVELLQTPTDEFPPSRPRIVLGDLSDPPTPPSPTTSLKESRLAPFLRERTSGRLANNRTRPVSMPPMRGLDILAMGQNMASIAAAAKKNVRATATATVPPPSPSRSVCLNTPPKRVTPIFTSSPASPTGSIRSFSTSSPTLSVPTITCTPAPARTFRDDGSEHDSDEEEDEVVLFEGDLSVESDRSEREERGRALIERLTLRRGSD